MPKVHCSDCEREVAMHELETKTVAQRDGFDTRYRCPFCHADLGDVTQQFA
jgi:DNA-directed RNA polymerase subunit RPC12/RpoP